MFESWRDFPRRGTGGDSKVILGLFFLSVLFYAFARTIPEYGSDALKGKMVEAAKIMRQATVVLKECREERRIRPDLTTDINDTGLIGLELSSITTSLGNLKAKRTSADPNFAGLAVYLLDACGAGKGDIIAVGASSSFPALIIAVLSAAKAMEVKPLVICSLGASQWGANNPAFHWLEIWDCLYESGIFSVRPIALSLGGERDMGTDMGESGRMLLEEDIRRSGLPFIREPDLRGNVRLRMDLYEKNAGERSIKAFVNIGGSWANMGADSSVLHLKPGLNRLGDFPPPEKRGVIFAMAAKNVPVIHLLYIKGLAREYGFPWDPLPLPQPGKGLLYDSLKGYKLSFVISACLFLVLVLTAVVFRRRFAGED